MMNTLLGKKIDQSQRFLDNGKGVAITEVSAPDNTVLQVKTIANDGYTAIQLGLGAKKNGNKALIGHSKKAKLDKAPAFIREVRLEAVAADDLPNIGDLIGVEAVFKPGDIVAVTGVSKGKGFAGVVKRHGFRGGPKKHGQSDTE